MDSTFRKIVNEVYSYNQTLTSSTLSNERLQKAIVRLNYAEKLSPSLRLVGSLWHLCSGHIYRSNSCLSNVFQSKFNSITFYLLVKVTVKLGSAVSAGLH